MSANSIGYVVWGITSGFQKNLFSHNLSETIKSSLNDIRDLCQSHYSDFYSIERIGSETLVSLYDPTVMDYSGSRKAYIVFSIIFPSGSVPSASVLELLASFKNYYKVESSGLPNQEIFHRKLVEFTTKTSTNSNASVGTQIGFKDYTSIDQIKEVFAELDILDYSKIYFFDRPNAFVSSNPNFIVVTSLERKYTVKINNFISNEHKINKNGIEVKPEGFSKLDEKTVQISNLRKFDKITISHNSNIVENFDAHVKASVYLSTPIKIDPTPSSSNQFVLTNFDSKRYYVKVNERQIQSLTNVENKLMITLPSGNAMIQIIDKEKGRLAKTLMPQEMQAGSFDMNTITEASSTGQVSGQNGGGGIDISGTDTGSHSNKSGRFKKSLMALFLVLFIGALGFTFWKVGLFTDEPPVIVTGPGAVLPQTTPTPPTLPTPGNPKDSTKVPGIKSDLKNPDGYTVLEKAKTYITEGGYKTPSNGVTYRYFNGKWETKQGTSWIPTKTSDKNYHLGACFSKNAPPATPLPPPSGIPPVVSGTPPPPPPPAAATCDCNTAVKIKNEAIAANSLGKNARKAKKNELIESNASFIKTCATECDTYIKDAQSAIDDIKN
jgi:hypothetical protein